jgi:hypothetical protein
MSVHPQYHFTDAARALIAGLRREGDVFNRGFPLFLDGDDVVYHSRLVAERPGVSPYVSTEIFLLLVDGGGEVVEGTDWGEEEIEAAYQALHRPFH